MGILMPVLDKPKVFLSHITEERQLADFIKRQVMKDFLGMLDVFVSSDQVSISVGSKWLEEIDEALKSAHIELILCSHESVRRPWVNFEAGAGWVKGIPIVPVCHTGMRPVDLPIPLNMLQGIAASDESGWDQVYKLLASKLGSAVPQANFAELLRDVGVFEHEYGLVREVSGAVRAVIKILPALEQIFRPDPPNRSAGGDVTDILLDKMRPHLDTLQAKGMVMYGLGGNKIVVSDTGGGGNVIDFKIQVQPSYYAIASKIMIA